MILVAKSVCDLWPPRSEEGCCVFCSTLRNCGHSSAARASGQQKPADDGATLYMLYGVSAQSVPSQRRCLWPPGHLATWPPAKWSQAGRRSAGQGAKFEAAGWEDAAVWRSNTVEKSASWFD